MSTLVKTHMAAELGLPSLTQLQQLLLSATQSQPNPNSTVPSWMQNSNGGNLDHDDDDSWQIRAFAEDTGHIMGTTWPPRSYTCTFCHREFRSAQALGGHMNVHRKDRARLNHNISTIFSSRNSTAPPLTPPLMMLPNHGFMAQGGVCLLYQLPNPNGFFGRGIIDSNSMTILDRKSVSPAYNLHQPNSSNNSFHSEGELTSSSTEFSEMKDSDDDVLKESKKIEIDLELRLGQRPTAP